MSVLIENLTRYGYLSPKTSTLSTNEIDEALERYRDFLGIYDLSTDELMKLERCGCPDIQTDSVGSGSWPKACHAEYPNNHAFAVWFDLAGMPQHWGPAFEKSWSLVVDAYAGIGMAFFRTSDRSKSNTIVTWQRGSGWIGLAIVPRNPRCGQTIWAKYDNRYGSSFAIDRRINQLAFLMAHEFGHNMGMSHTRGGIMNPTLINGTFHPDQWRRNDPAFPILRRYFGGVPITDEAPIWTIPAPEQPRE